MGKAKTAEKPDTAEWMAAFTALSLCLYAVVLVRNAWLSDDSFVTFRVADNFIHERVEAFTDTVLPV